MELDEAKEFLENNGYRLNESFLEKEANCSYSNDDLELEYNGKMYRIEVYAEAIRKYYPGDYWNPSEEEYEIVRLDTTWFEMLDNGEEKQVEETKEMGNFITDYLYDNEDLFEYEEEDADYYPEEDDYHKWQEEEEIRRSYYDED